MERENRKVLISFKVSTLLLTLLSITLIIVLAAVVSNKLQNNTEIANAKNNNLENNQQNVIENKEETKNNQNEQRTIKAEITSRSADSRQIENNSVVENLTQGVGMIAIPIENSIHEETENIALEEDTISIEEVTISKDMNLTVRTGLSREDFIQLISGVEEDKSNFFEENAGLIYDICEKYQINEIFFCGLIAGESGWNIAANHRRTNNFISLMSSKGLIKYNSVEEGLEKAAQTLHNNYLTEGGRFYYGPTLAGVKTKFCPASSTWINLIYKNMEKILN